MAEQDTSTSPLHVINGEVTNVTVITQAQRIKLMSVNY